MATTINVKGGLTPTTPNTPLDVRTRVTFTSQIGNIPLAYVGMLIHSEEDGKYYKVTSLKSKVIGDIVVPDYNPATWEEFFQSGLSVENANTINNNSSSLEDKVNALITSVKYLIQNVVFYDGTPYAVPEELETDLVLGRVTQGEDHSTTSVLGRAICGRAICGNI